MKSIFLSLTILMFFGSTVYADALGEARALGAPMQAVERAMKFLKSPAFSQKDAMGVFDISKPAGQRRFFLIDFKSNKTTAFYMAHGKSNGGNSQATNFRGFQSNHDMTPLGPLRTKDAKVWSHYADITDKYTGQTYSGLLSMQVEGAATYNSYIDRQPGIAWILHPAWYVSSGYRAKNPGQLGRSLGCLAMDPAVSNSVARRLNNGYLIYVTVGNQAVENFL